MKYIIFNYYNIPCNILESSGEDHTTRRKWNITGCSSFSGTSFFSDLSSFSDGTPYFPIHFCAFECRRTFISISMSSHHRTRISPPVWPNPLHNHSPITRPPTHRISSICIDWTPKCTRCASNDSLEFLIIFFSTRDRVRSHYSPLYYNNNNIMYVVPTTLFDNVCQDDDGW